jgi:hypothetical protein
VYITQLEFKSREELQLMPQTAEEHLIALEDENEDSESEQGTPTGPDVEVTKNANIIPTLFPVIKAIWPGLSDVEFALVN